MPVLSSAIREDLYELVLSFIHGPEDLEMVTGSLTEMVARGKKLSTRHMPQEEGTNDSADVFMPQFSHDRQCLRSDVGYAGLKNLSNTCYLNSLFSQLFMNLQFRELILNVRILDDTRQSLIVELSKVFAFMQNSYERSIDPDSAVSCIMTYDNEQIDVAVQMDVDEFFNLLFDRLESQILDVEAKRTFKSLYGGQLVQQVKSRECEHISERLEPFSVVQVEIKGKTGLTDSLRAYVEGEILQGDNKYSCTSCGRHVDAVKRACLKHIPDHLIFNLKRFDYDIMTGTRCKINDEFQFPDEIDMAPYTADHLIAPDEPIRPDIFELTGIIVHAGTADSGHYYSFIRQRPSSRSKQDSWVQFNDIDVSFFDPGTIRDNCFGGVDTSSNFHWPKINNAYMLFYQRTSSIRQFEEMYVEHDINNPVRLPLEHEIERHIMQRNELFVRSYCAQDPSHARFVRQILENMRTDDANHCSPLHELETKVLRVTLDYVQQVSSRWKEVPEFDATVKTLKLYASACAECATCVVNWYLEHNNICDTILRSPYPVVRREFGRLLCAGLSKLSQVAKMRSSMIPEPAEEQAEQTVANHTPFFSVVKQLAAQWTSLARFGRSWNEYFDVLTTMVQLGFEEAFMVLEHHFLAWTLELIYVHAGAAPKGLRIKYQQYLNARERHRIFHHAGLINFFAALLEWIDLRDYGQTEIHEESDKVFLANWPEARLLGLSGPYLPGDVPRFEWLRRVVVGRQSPEAAARIVARLAGNKRTGRQVLEMLDYGLKDDQVQNSVAFLEPALVFCAHTSTFPQATIAIKNALETVETINGQFGKDYLDFIVALMGLTNDVIPIGAEEFTRLVLNSIGSWAPALLVYPNNEIHADVRGEAFELVRRELLAPAQEVDLAEPRGQYIRGRIQQLTLGCTRHVQEVYLDTSVKNRAVLQPGQAGPIVEVMETGLSCFDTETADDERVIEEIAEVITALRLKADTAAEVLSNSWQDNESDVADVSEFEQSDVVSP